MDRIELNSIKREKSTKGAVKELRKSGLVPAVVYGKKVSSISLAVDKKELVQALSTSAGANVLIDLVIKNGKKKKETVMVKEIQKHPFKDLYLHVDFIGISLKDKIQVKVPIYFKGEPQGVKDGGISSIQVREVMVESLPTAIPESIEVNISGLQIGDVLSIGDLRVPEGVEITDDPNETIISVVVPAVVEEPVDEKALEGEIEEAEERHEGEGEEA
ncbi:MAG: 50S ribosomal protein L25 [Firmicutes bacterium HGW-Firmicutes-13]|nr:MAG: 50S ribosomal protein L25 [Firmicutes bacterium HGW-Firmicutes-13]